MDNIKLNLLKKNNLRFLAITFVIATLIGCYMTAPVPDFVDYNYTKEDVLNKKILFIPIVDLNFESITIEERKNIFKNVTSDSNDTSIRNQLSKLFYAAVLKQTKKKSIYFGDQPALEDLIKIGKYVEPIGNDNGVIYAMDYLVDSTIIDSITKNSDRWPKGARWTYLKHTFYRTTKAYLDRNGSPDFFIFINEIKFTSNLVESSDTGKYCQKKRLKMTGAATVWDCKKNQPMILEEFISRYISTCEYSIKNIHSYVKDAAFKIFFKTPLEG